MAIKLKRAYDPSEASDGFRILVDRIWPRGIKKDKLHLDLWLKEIAPSTELRKWFNHEAEKWDSFIKKYELEIKDSEALKQLKKLIKVHKMVTLIYSAKNEENNQAVAIKSFLK
ncbi:MAG: DUF488 family protein [Ferruginibacter sp.]